MKYILLCLILTACGQRDKYRENYGVGTDSQLSVSDKHMGGYGRTQCLLCHNVELNVHRGINSGETPQDAIRGAQAQGSAYCLKCHSDN
jgi:hypothetical protein